MITISDKKKCCGCSACSQRCPTHSITMQQDNEGFLYPYVDTTTCIDCGLCEKVCSTQNPAEAREPRQVFAAINKNEKIRMLSSSGGIFTLLAEKVINEGGVVFGARFDEEWQVTLDYTENLEELAAFRGSKYVQASTGETYKQCEQFLKDGRKVLFTGTPCQIAGLHQFLCNQYVNLTTCDFACHGIPSPKVWRMYLDEIIDGANRAITDVKFRNKDNGWKEFNFQISYDKDCNVTTLSSCHKDNLYMRAFLRDMILRPSCHDCKAKQGRSMSDITIADYWGIQINHPEMDDDKGTGLVLIHTQKGREFFENLQVTSLETDYNEIVSFNPVIIRSVKPHSNREKFFSKLDKTQNLGKLIISCTKPSCKQRIRTLFFLPKRVLRKLLKNRNGETEIKSNNNISSYPTKPISIGSIQTISFRDKNSGWKTYRMVIQVKE